MNKMIFKKLFIFSSHEKKAKKIEFVEGKNIITSSPDDGTDRGKSVIMKSLYHTLGADCFFDAKWNDNSKTYIVECSIDNKDYWIYRCNKLFKVCDEQFNLLFKTIDRQDLAEFFSKLFKFAVELPDRSEEKLEITPPAFNYLLYFLDQDKLSGPNFASFDKLSQYPNYKENVLYYHFGVFDDKYFKIIRQLELLKEELNKLTKQKYLTEEMLEKVNQNINGITYSNNIDLLQSDVKRSKNQYSSIAKSLNDIRNKLITLRNEKEELLMSLNSLALIDKTNEKQISSLQQHTCPFCKSEVEDTLDLKISKYNLSDDIILLSNDLQISISTIERKINREEESYKEWLLKMKTYEKTLGEQTTEINDVLKHKGYIEVKDSLISEINDMDSNLSINATNTKAYKKEEKEYNEIKKKINQRYYELMLTDKNKFGLEEIDSKSFEKITKTFSAGGSNKPISTVIWYVNLIKIKNEFNPSAINFPVVFDSPNNAETDTHKKIQVYQYLVDNIDTKNQLIVSGIGYSEENYNGIKFDNVIYLENSKYEVLCEKDFLDNIELLKSFSSR